MYTATRMGAMSENAVTVRDPSGLYRLQVGGYRVAYQVLDGELVILAVKVGDGRDGYRTI